MEYLLKVSAIVAIFYLSYKLLLQRDTFFEVNRWFLIIGLVSSFAFPFIVIPVYIEHTPINLAVFTINETFATENAEQPFHILDYLSVIYGLGIIFFFGRFLVQLVSLARVILKHQSIKKDRYTFIETHENVSPFSFFKWIVYNPNLFSQTELEQIISHEKTHAKQYHSIDILLTHLGCIALWFNPIMWFYNKDLKQNLEFIADRVTINEYNYKKSYQYTLLKSSMPSHQMALSNHFYNSLIKKRIVMLHTSKSKKINLLKYFLVLPVLVSFLMGFNTKNVFIENQEPGVSNKLETTNQIKSKEYKAIITKDLTDADLAEVIAEAEKKGITLTFKNIIRNTKNEIISIDAFFKNDKGSGTFNLNGEEPIRSFAFIQNEQGFGFGNMEETKLIVEQSGETHTSRLDVPNARKAAAEKETTPWKVGSERNNTLFKSGDTLYVDDKPNLLEKIIKEFNATPLYLIDGKKVSERDFKEIDPSLIERISTIKGDNSKVYGNKAKNGVIEVQLKSNTTKEHTIKLKGSALYIVDEKETDYDEFVNISPDAIYSINVLKGEDQTKKYGEKGKNGVVEITTKENAKSNNVQVTGFVKKADTTFIVKRANNSTTNEINKPLFIVDGVEKTSTYAKALLPENIESVHVLKGEIATQKYGKKGENGVIEVTLKK